MEALKFRGQIRFHWEKWSGKPQGFSSTDGEADRSVADPHSRGIMRLCSPIFCKFLASLELLDLNLTQTLSYVVLASLIDSSESVGS